MGRRVGILAFTFVVSIGAMRAQQAPAPAPPNWNAKPTQDPAVEPARYGEPTAGADANAGRYSGAPAPIGQTTPPRTAAPPQRVTPQRSTSQLAPVAAPRVQRAQVTKGSGRLPNDAGQIWREYDIRPYTQRVAGEAKPQQRVVDWILRETGYEAWHSETFGILNADRNKLTVYHTPAMQGIVADIVDRFVNSSAADRAFSMQIVTVRNPDWRVRALGMMTPISVQSPGLQGWIMPKENYALVRSEMARRSDVRNYNAAGQLVPNAQGIVFSTMRPRGYVKGIIPTAQAWPGYQPETGTIEEGASLEFTPLLSMDLQSAEAVIKLRMNQVEKMRRVSLDLPTNAATPGGNGSQRLQIEVPQMTMANLHERFRWPADQVLVLSMGLVATPGPDQSSTFSSMLPSQMKSPPRADALLFVEARNAATPTGPTAVPSSTPGAPVSTAVRPTPTFHGRY